jgi:outer membrane protein OmpA-like peptidoglycan-associated protein
LREQREPSEFEELKRVLFSPETQRLEGLEASLGRIEERAGSDQSLTNAVSRILIEAFRRAELDRHRELATTVAPVVVDAIRAEIRNSRDEVVEALYPITGRLVSAGIANAIRDLISRIDDRMTSIFSLRHWRWRFKAMLTGRPLSEIALAESRRAEIRRLFLIERGTGRLIARWAAHDQADGQADDRGELVAGLVAAITDFARNVFAADAGDLRTIDLGGTQILVRASQRAIVAADYAGTLRPHIGKLLDDAFMSLIDRFDRGEEISEPSLGEIAARIDAAAPEETARGGRGIVILLAGLLAILAFVSVGPISKWLHAERVERAFSKMLTANPQLRRYPLKAVMDDASSTVIVRGLRPEGISDEAIIAALRKPASPYAVRVDADTAINPRRVAELEHASADLGRIAAETQAAVAALGQRIDAATQAGSEDQAKLRLAIDNEAGRIASIREEFADRTAELKTAQGKLEGAISALKGAVDTPLDRLERLMRRTSIFFSQNEAVADPDGAGRALDQLAELLKQTGEHIRVAGHTDEIGSLALNRALSHRRAEAVVRMLVERGVPAQQLSIVSLATSSPLADAPGGSGSPNRRVTFALGLGD